MRGSRVMLIVALVAIAAAIGLALALKHQDTARRAKRHQHELAPIPATR